MKNVWFILSALVDLIFLPFIFAFTILQILLTVLFKTIFVTGRVLAAIGESMATIVGLAVFVWCISQLWSHFDTGKSYTIKCVEKDNGKCIMVEKIYEIESEK